MRHHRLLNALATLLVWATATASAAEDQQRAPAPAGARLVLETAAQGVQIYTCEKAGDLYRWTPARSSARWWRRRLRRSRMPSPGCCCAPSSTREAVC